MLTTTWGEGVKQLKLKLKTDMNGSHSHSHLIKSLWGIDISLIVFLSYWPTQMSWSNHQNYVQTQLLVLRVANIGVAGYFVLFFFSSFFAKWKNGVFDVDLSTSHNVTILCILLGSCWDYHSNSLSSKIIRKLLISSHCSGGILVLLVAFSAH